MNVSQTYRAGLSIGRVGNCLGAPRTEERAPKYVSPRKPGPTRRFVEQKKKNEPKRNSFCTGPHGLHCLRASTLIIRPCKHSKSTEFKVAYITRNYLFSYFFFIHFNSHDIELYIDRSYLEKSKYDTFSFNNS